MSKTILRNGFMQMDIDRECDLGVLLQEQREAKTGSDAKYKAAIQNAISKKTITGYDQPSYTTYQTASATKIESLSNFLTMLAHGRSNVKTYFRVPTVQVENVYHEFDRYIRHTDYANNSVVSSETTAGSNSQPVFERDAVQLGIYRLSGSVSDVSLLQAHLGNINHKALLGSALATTLITSIGRDFWHARRSSTNTTNNFYFNGILAQHKRIGTGEKFANKSLDDYYNSPYVHDARGEALTQDDVIDITEQLAYSYASSNIVGVAGPSVWSEFWKEVTKEKQRFIVGNETPQQAIGETINTIHTNYGKVTIDYDLFFDPVDRWIRFGEIENRDVVDNAPVVATNTNTNVLARAGADSSKFASSDAGFYHWGVVAVNTNGRSKLVVLGGAGTGKDTDAVTVAASGAADLQFTLTTESTKADYFEIYRTKRYSGSQDGVAVDTKFYRMFSVVVGDDVTSNATASESKAFDGATQTSSVFAIRDKNRHIAGTGELVFYDANPSKDRMTMYKAQLQPATAFQLARVGALTQMFVSEICCPVLLSWTRMIYVINAKASDGRRYGVQ